MRNSEGGLRRVAMLCFAPAASCAKGGNWPCRPHNRLHAIAATSYKQYAGAVSFYALRPAPVPDVNSIPPCFDTTNKNDTARVSFLFVGGDGGN